LASPDEGSEIEEVKIMTRARIALPAVFVLLFAASAIAQGTSWTLFPSRSDAPASSKVEHGKTVFHDLCSGCHGPVIKGASPGIGATMPGTDALAAKYKGEKPALLEDRRDLTAPFIKIFVRNGVSVMPRFRKTELSDADLDALSAYLTRNNKP
jgi:mono/diheme cytochrome c family protein